MTPFDIINEFILLCLAPRIQCRMYYLIVDHECLGSLMGGPETLRFKAKYRVEYSSKYSVCLRITTNVSKENVAGMFLKPWTVQLIKLKCKLIAVGSEPTDFSILKEIGYLV